MNDVRRSIKLRAWVPLIGSDGVHSGHYHMFFDPPPTIRDLAIAIMEFTGLYLCGDGVWEGDVLEFHPWTRKEPNGRGVVIYRNGAFYVRNLANPDEMLPPPVWSDPGQGGRVIGNIHENPELAEISAEGES